jgi:hypothetical protein
MDPDPQKPDETHRPADEYEAASQAMNDTEGEHDDYKQHAKAYKKTHRHPVRKMLIILGALVLVSAAGFGAYVLFLKDDGKKTGDDTDTNQNSSQTPPANQTDQVTTKTEHYISNSFMLEFDHPEDWTVTETSGSGQLTVQSPALQLESANSETITGQVVFKIRDKQQPLPELDNGNAVAIRESEKIAYLKPSSAQRGSTYLSFLRYANSDSGLDGVYITGDYGYQKDQAIPKADFTPVDPIISLTFVQCADGSCGGESTAMAISDEAWQNAEFSKPLKAIFQSLTIN